MIIFTRSSCDYPRALMKSEDIKCTVRAGVHVWFIQFDVEGLIYLDTLVSVLIHTGGLRPTVSNNSVYQ